MKKLSNDKLMDAFKAFEVKNQDEIKGGYWMIVYGKGRNDKESYATVYDSATHISSQGYVTSSYEKVHQAGGDNTGGNNGGGSGNPGGGIGGN